MVLAASTTGGTLHAAVTGGPQTYTIAVTGMSHNGQVVATIPGGAASDGALNPSVASTSSDNAVGWTEVVNPTITKQNTSAHPWHDGWFRSPVSIAFTCKAGSAALSGPCPATVVLSAETKGTTVTGTIHATDGGFATLTVGPIRIDKTKPTLTIKGVTSGQSYKHAPTLQCVAHDALSGIASCVISEAPAWTGRAVLRHRDGCRRQCDDRGR